MEIDIVIDDTSESDASTILVVHHDNSTTEDEDDISFQDNAEVDDRDHLGAVNRVQVNRNNGVGNGDDTDDEELEVIAERAQTPELIEVDSGSETEDETAVQSNPNADEMLQRPPNPVPPCSPLFRPNPAGQEMPPSLGVPATSRHVSMSMGHGALDPAALARYSVPDPLRHLITRPSMSGPAVPTLSSVPETLRYHTLTTTPSMSGPAVPTLSSVPETLRHHTLTTTPSMSGPAVPTLSSVPETLRHHTLTTRPSMSGPAVPTLSSVPETLRHHTLTTTPSMSGPAVPTLSSVPETLRHHTLTTRPSMSGPAVPTLSSVPETLRHLIFTTTPSVSGPAVPTLSSVPEPSRHHTLPTRPPISGPSVSTLSSMPEPLRHLILTTRPSMSGPAVPTLSSVPESLRHSTLTTRPPISGPSVPTLSSVPEPLRHSTLTTRPADPGPAVRTLSSVPVRYLPSPVVWSLPIGSAAPGPAVSGPSGVPQVSRHVTVTTGNAVPNPTVPHQTGGVQVLTVPPDVHTDIRPGMPGTSDLPLRLSGSHNQSLEEFRTPKKYKPKSPVKTAVQSLPETQNEDTSECPICFEAWTNSGSHRLASLKCGHLFGQSCIEKWLKGQGGKCPQCNAKATKKDVRVLYAKAIMSVDTSERDRAVSELGKEREARREAELAAAQERMRCQVALEEVSRLRQDLERARQQVTNTRQMSTSSVSSTQGSRQIDSGSHSFVFDRMIKVWEPGSCRVMAYNPQLATLVVSQPSASPLFPGFGVKKISSLDFKTTQYVSIHQKMIRDLAFNPSSQDGILLSCAMDKTVKMTSLTSSTVVQSYQCSQPVWSCVWNTDNSRYFYAGQQNGIVSVFDIRNTMEQVQQLNNVGSGPAVSLQYVPLNPESSFKPGGLLVGQLSRTTFFEARPGDDYRPHALPMEAQLTCLSLEGHTRHLLASYRPSVRNPSARHQVYELRSTPGPEMTCMANKMQTFHGGGTQKMLARSRLLQHPTDPDRLLVCAADEASQCLFIWDANNGLLKQKIPTHACVIDICSITVNDQYYLAALTEKNVRLHKWTSSLHNS